jgi:hypothetical protein
VFESNLKGVLGLYWGHFDFNGPAAWVLNEGLLTLNYSEKATMRLRMLMRLQKGIGLASDTSLWQTRCNRVLSNHQTPCQAKFHKPSDLSQALKNVLSALPASLGYKTGFYIPTNLSSNVQTKQHNPLSSFAVYPSISPETACCELARPYNPLSTYLI